jgi:nucleotide-binding universal stress UspA family protein
LSTLQHILVPLDFSQCSEEALPYAKLWAKKYGAQITLLHVIPMHMYVGSYVGDELHAWQWSEQVLLILEQEARKKLATVFSPAERLQFRVIEKVTRGVPFAEILAEANAQQVDLIVMATHGRTGVSHVMLGSVAEQVVRAAPCPVLTIRKSMPETGEEKYGEERRQ